MPLHVELMLLYHLHLLQKYFPRCVISEDFSLMCNMEHCGCIGVRKHVQLPIFPDCTVANYAQLCSMLELQLLVNC